MDYQTSLSGSYENIGLIQASQGRVLTGNKKVALLEQARSNLLKAESIYRALDARKAIPAEYAVVPARIRHELDGLDRSTRFPAHMGMGVLPPGVTSCDCFF